MNKTSSTAAGVTGFSGFKGKALAAAAGCMFGLLAATPMLVLGQPATDKPAQTQPTTPPTSPPATPPSNQPLPRTPEGVEPKTETPAKETKPEAETTYVLGHTVKDIDGVDVDLASYKGKVLLVVNVASKCGFTPQYLGLQELYTQYKDQGLVVLAFPSNDFGNQEPGSEKEIKELCTAKYKVDFPMFSKVKVIGAEAHPFFKQLAEQKAPAGGEPKWNFNKYLIDRKGNAVEHFESGMKPTSDELKKKVENLLAAK